MTLTTIKNDIKAFGKKKLEYMRGYIAMQEDFQDKLQKQLIGKVYAEQELLKYKKEGENYSQNTVQLLYQQLEKEKNAELANHKLKEEPITADDAAELTLLSSIKLTATEMREYLEKYKNKPLALRKLEDIMENDTTLAYIEIDMEQFNQQQRLEKLVHFLNRKIDYFHGGLIINGDKIDLVQHEMIVEGNSEAMDAELQNYLA
ncbi:hypothetical protein JavanS99_0007 [Streptococcus satellite phage Javan99]|uniref:hypothetical protein n=1 Tax=Streptococcus castoreus TaxID=254786 RepID=UPI000429CD62|nr:hypothetical protein [Streptococcus castoreus]QBX13629.1 hypothetical protein JavanS99_0007 [Streptococcus satellite phage Javan99]